MSKRDKDGVGIRKKRDRKQEEEFILMCMRKRISQLMGEANKQGELVFPIFLA